LIGASFNKTTNSPSKFIERSPARAPRRTFQETTVDTPGEMSAAAISQAEASTVLSPTIDSVKIVAIEIAVQIVSDLIAIAILPRAAVLSVEPSVNVAADPSGARLVAVGEGDLDLFAISAVFLQETLASFYVEPGEVGAAAVVDAAPAAQAARSVGQDGEIVA